MQRLNTLWRITEAASTVRDIAQHTKTYHFAVNNPITFYLRAENAAVTIIRWDRPAIEVTVTFQGVFGWRIMTEQDEAGVYIATGRRPVVGGLSSAKFVIRVPNTTYLVLKLLDSDLILQGVDETVRLEPPDPGTQIILDGSDTR